MKKEPEQEIIEVLTFIKDRMATKDDLKVYATKEDLQKELQPIKDEIFAINGKLDGIGRRIDRETERNFEQDVKIKALQNGV